MNNEIRYQFLKENDLENIHQAFMLAFADYQVDVSYMTTDVMRNRFIKNGVRFDLSVAAYCNNELIGFTIVGVDQHKNRLSAFDVMTGIVKDYRGLGVAKEMFDYMLPKLKENNIEKFVLEVLKPNESAIKAYTKAGFEIVRELDCYELLLNDVSFESDLGNKISIKPIPKNSINDFKNDINWIPSWENSLASIERIDDEVTSLGAYDNEALVGILIYYPTLNWIMQIIVKKEFRKKGIATSLISELVHQLPKEIEKINFHNIERDQKGCKEFLLKNGFKEIIGQYEMELTL